MWKIGFASLYNRAVATNTATSQLPSAVSITSLALLNSYTDLNITESNDITVAVDTNKTVDDDVNGTKTVTLIVKRNSNSNTTTRIITGFDSETKQNEISSTYVDEAISIINGATFTPKDSTEADKTASEASSGWTTLDIIKNSINVPSGFVWPSNVEVTLSSDSDSVTAYNDSGSVVIKLNVSAGRISKSTTMTVSGYQLDWSKLEDKLNGLTVASGNTTNLTNFKSFWNLLKIGTPTISTLMQALQIQSGATDLESTFSAFELVSGSYSYSLIEGSTKGVKNTVQIKFKLKDLNGGSQREFTLTFAGYIAVDIYAWNVSPVLGPVSDSTSASFNNSTATVKITEYPDKNSISTYLNWLSKASNYLSTPWYNFAQLIVEKVANLSFPNVSGLIYNGGVASGIILYPISTTDLNNLYSQYSTVYKQWDRDTTTYNTEMMRLISEYSILGWSLHKGSTTTYQYDDNVFGSISNNGYWYNGGRNLGGRMVYYSAIVMLNYIRYYNFVNSSN